jgi:hypothetical protein
MLKLARSSRFSTSLGPAALLLSIAASLGACAAQAPRGALTASTAQPPFWGWTAEATAQPSGPTFWGYSAASTVQPEGPTFWGYTAAANPRATGPTFWGYAAPPRALPVVASPSSRDPEPPVSANR